MHDKTDNPTTTDGHSPSQETGDTDELEHRAFTERPTLSIRAKVILSFSLFFALCIAVTSWSIWMASDLTARIDFLEVAGDFMMEVQQARRYEKNFLLYGTNLDDALHHLEVAESQLKSQGNTIGKIVGTEHTDTMASYLNDYHSRLRELGSTDDTTRRQAIVPILRRDGAKIVSFAEDFVNAERANVKRHLLLAQRVPFLFLGALLLLMVVAGTWLSQSLLLTLMRFMAYTKRIGEGDFSPITPVRKFKDEFSQLAEAFNSMTRELTRRHDILVESHKLRAIGTLVAGVAHELNNPLNNTMLSASVLKEEWDDFSEDEKMEIIDDVISETERSQRIVRNLLDFARESEAKMQPLDLERIVQESVRLVANQVRMARLTLRTELEDNLPHVHGDEQMLKQVFVNLMLNAVDALPPRGSITVSARMDSKKDGFLVVKVQDDGPGIPEHFQQRIFEPFFTTKGKGKGTGLGLSVSQGIIHKLGGFLKVESEEGEGTTFIVSLPVTDFPSDIMSG